MFSLMLEDENSMATQALTINDVAAELGRSAAWVYANAHKLPEPIISDGKMTWSAPAFYAWMDQKVPENLKPLTAVYRALMAVAAMPRDAMQQQLTTEAAEEADRAKLNARFGGR
jgi:hypothetical protein